MQEDIDEVRQLVQSSNALGFLDFIPREERQREFEFQKRNLQGPTRSISDPTSETTSSSSNITGVKVRFLLLSNTRAVLFYLHTHTHTHTHTHRHHSYGKLRQCCQKFRQLRCTSLLSLPALFAHVVVLYCHLLKFSLASILLMTVMIPLKSWNNMTRLSRSLRVTRSHMLHPLQSSENWLRVVGLMDSFSTSSLLQNGNPRKR